MDKQKNARFAFTAWKQPKVNEEFILYMCWAKEYTPSTGLEHYQGYVEFIKDYALFQVKSLFKDKTMHVEAAKHDRETNRKYCFKSVNLGRYEFGDNGEQLEEEDILDIFQICKDARKALGYEYPDGDITMSPVAC